MDAVVGAPLVLLLPVHSWRKGRTRGVPAQSSTVIVARNRQPIPPLSGGRLRTTITDHDFLRSFLSLSCRQHVVYEEYPISNKELRITKWASEENARHSVKSFTRFAHFIIGYSLLDIGCSVSFPIYLAALRQRLRWSEKPDARRQIPDADFVWLCSTCPQRFA